MRFFRVSVKAGQQPVRIIADTMEDAKRQAQGQLNRRSEDHRRNEGRKELVLTCKNAKLLKD